MIPIAASIVALAFIAYLTWDTMTSIRAVQACDWAWPEYKQLAEVFQIMWWVLVGFGLTVVTGLINPFEWVPFV